MLLIQIMRENGVLSLKMDGIELVLGEKPSPWSMLKPSHHRNEPDNDPYPPESDDQRASREAEAAAEREKMLYASAD